MATTEAPTKSIGASSAFSASAWSSSTFDRASGFAVMRREHDQALALKAGRLRFPRAITTRGFPENGGYRVETVWTFEL